eukprot:GHVT01063895.1.p1 GENE.GHVT01063895.1~~GHVT01063895.1.p1  ORF type:complete len:199 (+),score=33.36 GHVT01063895.1:193-789(+)
MVKRLGVSRSRRAVSRRVKSCNQHFVDLSKCHTDATLRQLWDKKLTVAQNLSKIPIGRFASQLPDDEVDDRKPLNVPKLSERDVVQIRALVAKYDKDTQAMSRDRRLNLFQWSSAQCAKRSRLLSRGMVCNTARDFILAGPPGACAAESGEGHPPCDGAVRSEPRGTEASTAKEELRPAEDAVAAAARRTKRLRKNRV